jgi:Methyltransferase domain
MGVIAALKDKRFGSAVAARFWSAIAKSSRTLVHIDYPVTPRCRLPFEAAPHGPLADLVRAGEERYATHLSDIARLRDYLAAIPAAPTINTEPFWGNGWMPPFDAASLYSFTAKRKPQLYLEIGSGSSTKFVRRAIDDHRLTMRIISIDPHPRSEISSICDEVVRRPLEDCSLGVFERLGGGDIVFFDGSHRAFQNSDVTVFFTEILPRLPPGVLVGIHDIFLPWDYPPEWSQRYYNEQYLLACYLLGGGETVQVELPVFYCGQTPTLRPLLDEIWRLPSLANLQKEGGIFWFSRVST